MALRPLSNDERIKTELKTFQSSPVKDRFRKLIIEVATEQGEATLRVFKTAHGHIWADPAVSPTVRTLHEAAQEMSLPLSEVIRMYRATMAEAIKRLRASPEYKEWQSPEFPPQQANKG